VVPDCTELVLGLAEGKTRGLHPGYALVARRAGEQAVDIQDIRKIEGYMRRLFGNAKLRVVPRPKKDDSAEVYIGDEFIGVIFVDEEEKDSYNFNMSILGVDLV
jgi:hypothetical protein